MTTLSPGERAELFALQTAGSGLQALHDARDRAAREIADAMQRVLPRGFRGRITATVDNGVVRAQDVAIEMRPPQSKVPMK